MTGASAGSSATANDLDGRTSIGTPAIVLPPLAGQRLTFALLVRAQRRVQRGRLPPGLVVLADGTRVPVFSVVGRAADVDGAWRTASVSLDAYAGQTIHLLFQAADGGAPNLLEVQLDDVRVTRPG